MSEEIELNTKATKIISVIALCIGMFLIGYFTNQVTSRQLTDKEIALNLEQYILDAPLPEISILKTKDINLFTVGEVRSLYVRYSMFTPKLLIDAGKEICFSKPKVTEFAGVREMQERAESAEDIKAFDSLNVSLR